RPPPRGSRRDSRGLNLEREAILQPTVREAAGDLLRAHHLDHHRSVARQALDYDLPALRHGPPPSARASCVTAHRREGEETVESWRSARPRTAKPQPEPVTVL